jgi:hypothetical protein
MIPVATIILSEFRSLAWAAANVGWLVSRLELSPRTKPEEALVRPQADQGFFSDRAQLSWASFPTRLPEAMTAHFAWATLRQHLFGLSKLMLC